tara:strand:+ start:929 stop:1477 length:549 start_codon:yes stop_codon:yes gene_type:complete
MSTKKIIRKKFFLKRKKKYFKVNTTFFNPLVYLLKKSNKINFKIGIYYPTYFELNLLKIFEVKFFRKFDFFLPIVEDKKSMNFYKWSKNKILFLNKFGILEPEKTKKEVPNIILVPLLAFDKKNNRLGYGKGFYDKYFKRYNKSKKILKIGIAFSFQRHHNLPVNKNDIKLDYILTEKGIIQ